MNWFTGIVLYVLIWWTALFAVLPIGTRPAAEADPASGWRGAPTHPHLLRKIVGTTLLAAVLWGGCYLVIRSGWISFRNGILALPTD
jgi:predicted secreted protein